MTVFATRQNDMVSGLLAEYALGGLSMPVRVLVESHLELSPEGEGWARDVSQIRSVVNEAPNGSALKASVKRAAQHDGQPHVLDRIEPVAFADRDAALDAVFARIEAGDDQSGVTPKALKQFLGMSLSDVPWKKVMPGLSEFKIPDTDGCEVSLLRIEGGKAMPVHTHHGSEITLVLQGGFSDDDGHYGVGDIAYADDEVNHKPVADAGEVCICFAVVDAPVELTGPIGRLVNTFRR